jgi:hypothetical protein
MKPPPGPERSQIETFVLPLFRHATAGNWISHPNLFPDQKATADAA